MIPSENKDVLEAPGLSLRAMSRPACALLLIWMLGAVLLSWVIFRGPILSSVIKRVPALREGRAVVARYFGEVER